MTGGVFCVQTPFTLTLRIWDIYILEGERVLPAMSYTILKLHRSKTLPVSTHQTGSSCCPAESHRSVCVCSSEHLMKLSMEELVEFLQESLSKNFYYEDDVVIEHLHTSMTELRRAKLDLPPPGTTAAS